MEQTDSDKNLYELAYLLPLSQAESAQSSDSLAKLKQMIGNAGGNITQEQGPLPKYLAYPIAKHKDVLFGFIRFTVKPEAIGELQKALRLESDVYRFSITHITETQLRQEQQASRVHTVGAQPTYTPKPKEATPEIKTEEFEKKLEEILKE